jgi:AcrR family transcriptional regulator
VDACVQLLDEHGRAGLSRAKIAERAGVSLPAVNRRFADVDEILVLVAQTPGSAPAPVDGARAPTSLREFLVDGLAALARAFAAGGVRRAGAELLAAAAGNTEVDAAFRATLAGLRAEGLTWVERARAEGEVAADVDGDLLFDLVTGSAYYRLLWRGESVRTDEVERVVDLVLRGARPSSVAENE